VNSERRTVNVVAFPALYSTVLGLPSNPWKSTS
jgi:hypothetical protein